MAGGGGRGGGGGFGFGGGGSSPTNLHAPGGFGAPGMAGAMNYNYDEDMGGAPSYDNIQKGIQGGAELGGLDEFGATDDQLEQMDNEIFEPLNSFDPDIREMLIDAVNAKVRRILSLDPSKFVNGMLPFGLRPDNETDVEAALKAKIRELLAQVDAIEEERNMMKDEVEELKRQIEAMRRRQGLGPGTPPDAIQQPQIQVPSPTTRRTLTSEERALELNETAGPSGYTEEQLQKLLAKAREEVKQEMMKAIRLLEAKIKQKDKEIEELRNKLLAALGKKPEKAAGEPAPEPEEDDGKDAELARLRAQLRRVQEELEEALRSPKTVEVIKEVIKTVVEEKIVEVSSDGDSSAAKKSQELLHRLLQAVTHELDLKENAKGQKAAEKILGTAPGKKSETENKICDRALKGLDVWTTDVLAALEGLKLKLAEKKQVSEPVIIIKEVEKIVEVVRDSKKESPRDGKCYNPAHRDLEKRIKELEDEISRLLLTIDELRRRIEAIQGIPGDPDEEKIMSIMERVGLKDLAEARDGPKLKGVFNRLYQDACQRITRYGMVRERVLLANKAYSAVLSAITTGDDPKSLGVPDFERLNETTKATLQGMWYHSDYLFKRCCEYAMTQGVEPHLLQSQHDHEPLEDTGVGIDDEMPRAKPRGVDRLPGRRGDRPRGAPSTPSKHDFEEAPTSFKAYMAAMQQAAGAALGKASPDKKSWKTALVPVDGGSSPDAFKTLKAACAPSSAGSGVTISLSTSRSLPALPRGRGMIGGGGDSDGGGGSPIPRSPIPRSPGSLLSRQL